MKIRYPDMGEIGVIFLQRLARLQGNWIPRGMWPPFRKSVGEIGASRDEGAAERPLYKFGLRLACIDKGIPYCNPNFGIKNQHFDAPNNDSWPMRQHQLGVSDFGLIVCDGGLSIHDLVLASENKRLTADDKQGQDAGASAEHRHDESRIIAFIGFWIVGAFLAHFRIARVVALLRRH